MLFSLEIDSSKFLSVKYTIEKFNYYNTLCCKNCNFNPPPPPPPGPPSSMVRGGGGVITVSFLQERLQKLKLQYLGLNQCSQESILQLKKILGHLNSTTQVVVPTTKLNCRFIQQQQNWSLKEKGSLQ